MTEAVHFEPCPFCGEEISLSLQSREVRYRPPHYMWFDSPRPVVTRRWLWRLWTTRYWVQCLCGARAPECSTPALAAWTWNTRRPPDSLAFPSASESVP